VEVDGPIHEDQVEYDAGRTDHFVSYSYRVLRFSNDQVLSELETVIAQIGAALVDDHAPLPPGGRGEGAGG
jgi:very-short-patch-repair endonuclease